jgi:hypothetical protein
MDNDTRNLLYDVASIITIIECVGLCIGYPPHLIIRKIILKGKGKIINYSITNIKLFSFFINIVILSIIISGFIFTKDLSTTRIVLYSIGAICGILILVIFGVNSILNKWKKDLDNITMRKETMTITNTNKKGLVEFKSGETKFTIDFQNGESRYLYLLKSSGGYSIGYTFSKSVNDVITETMYSHDLNKDVDITFAIMEIEAKGTVEKDIVLNIMIS